MQFGPTGSQNHCKAHAYASQDLAAGEEEMIGISDPLDGFPVEALMLNLDASLRVHTRAHFFRWTQGVLQSLIRHEVLICALCDDKSPMFRVESFSTKADPAIFGEMF